jgi:hypothetical protein
VGAGANCGRIPVYPVNPLQVARFRERLGVSGAKSDTRDAHVLADMVRTFRDQLRPIAGDSPEAEAVKVVTRVHKTLIWERTRHLLRLRHALREFFPAALVAFDDLAAVDALALLAVAPDPASAAALSLDTIDAALKRARRHGRADKAQAIAEALPEPRRSARRAGDYQLRPVEARLAQRAAQPRHIALDRALRTSWRILAPQPSTMDGLDTTRPALDRRSANKRRAEPPIGTGRPSTSAPTGPSTRRSTKEPAASDMTTSCGSQMPAAVHRTLSSVRPRMLGGVNDRDVEPVVRMPGDLHPTHSGRYLDQNQVLPDLA